MAIVWIALISVACTKNNAQELPTGQWRGEFTVQNEVAPFNFDVEDDTAGSVNVFLLNADERILLKGIRYESDSVIIPIELYDAVLIAKVNDDSLSGFLRKNQDAAQGLPFKAARNQDYRFAVKSKNAPKSVKGKWSVNLISERNGKPHTNKTVGLFEQEGSKVTGTILTTTGDYRYLEGVLDGNELKMSAFSGFNPLLILARLTDEGTIQGEFISPRGKTTLQAVRDDAAELPDPYSLTYLKDGSEKLSFSFPDLQTGRPVSLQDDKYKDKVVIVTITGSWCPNCIDEAAFLAPWYKENKDRGVEIIGLTFELKDDIDFARTRVGKMIEEFDIEYDILFAGSTDKASVAEKLPQLNAVLSYPTTFFIDKNGKVRKIHTGYTGPATGIYYEEFIQEFNETVTALLNENNAS